MTDLIPLFVDLDGTVIKEDIGQMALKKSLSINFLNFFNIIIRFFLFGKPSAKFYASKNYHVNFDQLNFNKSCLDFILDAKKLGRKVYLISGSHEKIIKKVAVKLNIFDDAYGTRKNYNMISLNKVKFIKDTLKINDFDYIGNGHQDLVVWENSKNIIYTNVSDKLLKKINLLKNKKIFIKEDFN